MLHIYYERQIPKCASHLTENQFNWVKRIFNMFSGGIRVDGTYKDINDEEFLIECLTKVNALKENYKDGTSNVRHDPNYREDPVMVTDEDIISLIRKYGEISHSLSLSGTISGEFSHTLEFDSEVLEEFSEDQIFSMDHYELEEHLSLDAYAVEGETEGFESVDVNAMTTTLRVLLPTPEYFCDPKDRLEKKVA